MPADAVFTTEFLEEIRFATLSKHGCKHPSFKIYGKTQGNIVIAYIFWNAESNSCTYFNQVSKPNSNTFSSYLHTQDDARKFLSNVEKNCAIHDSPSV
jgi:hypothetical protein